ncbi:ATP-dependent helicase, partial [bacterium]
LCEEFDATEIAAAALQMLWENQHSAAGDTEEAAADFEQPEVGMTRIFVGIGRNDNLRPGDLVGAIAGEAGLPGKSVGVIDILDRNSFVEVPSGDAQRVVDALRNTKIRNKKVKVELAQPAVERGGPGPSRRG